MRLTATTRPAVAVAYGAYRHGGHLRCGLLLVKAGTKHRTVTLRDPVSRERIRVRLPDELRGARGHARTLRVELEIL